MTDHAELLAQLDRTSGGSLHPLCKLIANAALVIRAEVAARQAAEAQVTMLQRQPKDLLPHGCTGMALSFDPGVLYIAKDGSGHLAIPETDFILEDDRYEGPDGAEGSVHWLARISADEMVGLRDFLTLGMDHTTAATTFTTRVRAEAMEEAARIVDAEWWVPDRYRGPLLDTIRAAAKELKA